jgi:hypothetical protein
MLQYGDANRTFCSDQRPWSKAHIDAHHGKAPQPTMSALTPPQGDQLEQACASNVNVLGPGGFTPLMVASMAPPHGGLEAAGGAHASTAECIPVLIGEGARTDARTDYAGKSIFMVVNAGFFVKPLFTCIIFV